MTKIIVVVWEGKSEIAFLQSFLKRQKNIKSSNIKSPIVYKIDDNYVLFSHPTLSTASHVWGDDTFSKWKTFKSIASKIVGNSYIRNGKDIEYVYLIFTDKDKPNSLNKEREAKALIESYCSNYKWSVHSIFACQEIETWFLAWFPSVFRNKYKEVDHSTLDILLRKYGNFDWITDTKWILTSIIKNTELDGTQEYKWRMFWEYIDIEQAKSLSSSFCLFLKKIDQLFW